MRALHALLGIKGIYVTNAHVKMARLALDHFENVIVMPCAQVRIDQDVNVTSFDRWMMTLTAFQELKLEFSSRLFLSDRIVYESNNITTVQQIKLLKKELYVSCVFCVGSDNLLPSTKNPSISRVEASWKDGVKLWNEYPWAVFQRPGTQNLRGMRLPPNCKIIEGYLPDISSTAVREKMLKGENWQADMPQAEVQYILNKNLDK